jgi:hypothetical protein
MKTQNVLVRRRAVLAGVLSLAAACEGTVVAPGGAGPPASIRIETRTPTTLPDSDMVVMRASVLDASGTILPDQVVLWRSLDPTIIQVAANGQIRGHENSFTLGREARVVATVASDSTIRDTTTVFTMRYAQGVNLAPNAPYYPTTFGQVALLAPGESSQLHATAFIKFLSNPRADSYGYDSLSIDQTRTWISRSPQVATVDGNGLVTARGDGLATIVVVARGSAVADSGIVDVRIGKLALSEVTPGSGMCALSTAGVVYCWSTSLIYSGNFATATAFGSRFPNVALAGAPPFVRLSNGGDFACGIATDGVTYCWATTATTLFGTTVPRNTPVAFGTGVRFASVHAGRRGACGLTADGVLYCWGDNSYGQLGDGTTVARSTPAPVLGSLRFSSVSAGVATCGIAAGDEAYCWGFNDAGGLGDGTTVSRAIPTPVTTSVRFVQIQSGAGDNYACGRTAVGQVYCWGGNNSGELGDGTTVNRSLPTLVLGGNVFVTITSGGGVTCGLATTGQAFCWGYDRYGAVGDGTMVDARVVPTPVAGGLRFSSILAGDSRVCGIADGVNYCWGPNVLGDLGTNLMQSVSVPTKLAGVSP